MKIDKLRALILLSWIVFAAACFVALASAAATHYKGLRFDDIVLSVRHLFGAIGPTLGALIGGFFSRDRDHVRLRPWQASLLLLLSCAYLLSFTFITGAMLLSDDFLIDQDATANQPAIDHYAYLTYLQPLVIGPLSFLFGKKSENSTRSAD